MKVKTSEASGAALDWMVAKCEGRTWGAVESFIAYHDDGEMNYSTNWAQGGPIIEREGIMLEQWKTTGYWQAANSLVTVALSGPTPLIAAMRCYVTSKLGEEVEIPEELK